MSGRGREEHFAHAELGLEKLRAPPCEWAVAGYVAVPDRLRHVGGLVSDETRAVEWDANREGIRPERIGVARAGVDGHSGGQHLRILTIVWAERSARVSYHS